MRYSRGIIGVIIHGHVINTYIYIYSLRAYKHWHQCLNKKIHYFKDITMINKLVRRHKNIICENININYPEENTIYV